MNRRAWLAFAAALDHLGGVPYLFIKIAVDHASQPAAPCSPGVGSR